MSDPSGRRRERLIFILPGPVPPNPDPRRNLYHWLSGRFEGHVVTPVWGRRGGGGEAMLQGASRACGRFELHATFSADMSKVFKPIWDTVFYLMTGLRAMDAAVHPHVIVTYGALTTGLSGLILKRLTGAKLVVFIPGNPAFTFAYESQQPARLDRLKQRVSRALLPLVINAADHVWLLYPTQLNSVPAARPKAVSVFGDFVPVSCIEPSDDHGDYLLLLGFPWYLKGVDILIQAFLRIAPYYPQLRLRVVGYCEDWGPYEALAAGHPRIELSRPVNYEAALQLIRGCRAFVLPSRTEAMGRVLLEAMAARKPIVASNVDGIPHYVHDCVNGLLFRSGDDEHLARQLRRILDDNELAAHLARNGFDVVRRELSERAFVERFGAMIDRVVASDEGPAKVSKAPWTASRGKDDIADGNRDGLA